MTKILTVNLIQDDKVLGLANKLQFDVVVEPPIEWGINIKEELLRELKPGRKKAHGQLSHVEMYKGYTLEKPWRIVLATYDNDSNEYVEFNKAVLFDEMKPVQAGSMTAFEKIMFISELPKEGNTESK